MKLTMDTCFRAAKWIAAALLGMAMAWTAHAQTLSTTTVQGTVYLANGAPGSGTLQLSWPAFTTANNQIVTAGRITVSIGADGFVSANLAANLGSTPAGLYYTAVYHMSDGTTSTEYWVVPQAAQASIAQVRAQVMPAAQAAQAVSKAYVDQAIQSINQNSMTSSGGTLTGPLYLSGDPSQSLQAADKHYVDAEFAEAVPMTGANVTGPLTSVQLGAAYQVDQFPGANFGAKLQACLTTVSAAYGGTCDARNFTGNLSMASNLAISTANTTVMLPCATIATASQISVTAGTRNVALRGCALRGASSASGSQGGTVILYSGTSAAVQVGDPTYAVDTMGFHLDNVVINTTAATSVSAQGFAAYRTQELDLGSLYFLGNSNQAGMTLDGTGNYTGGTFYDNAFNGFQTAVNAIGHQVSNSAVTDWLNASTFLRLHIDCPTANGSPIAGTYGINLQQGDGNTFTGGDVEGCSTALHLGANAQNNTLVGLRNENSTSQVVADSGSAYNNWITGGTMFTGQLTDNGTRNSFLDTFHRSFNGINGDWYGSQQDATVTNHFRLGIGSGIERGLLNRFQTDYGYRWTLGLSDAIAGEQFYQLLDELNNVYRVSIGQMNNGQSSTNNQTVLNAAGSGAVVLNGSNNSGTGGVIFGSGGPSATMVGTINNAGNAQFTGTLQVGGTAQTTGTMTVRNNADSEVDYYLWPGLTTNQKGSFTYKDWNGNSQWYMVKDASNNWALNSATGGLDSFKAYQNTNGGDTYINASNSAGTVRVNYETGSGSAFNIYGGNSGTLYASLTGTTSIKFPGLAASSGHNCLQVDNSGYLTNTGTACGSGSGSGTIGSGITGQVAYYTGVGTAIGGMSAVPVAAGGTGATTPSGALAALSAASLASTNGQNFAGPITAPAVNANVNGQVNIMTYGAKGDCATNDTPAFLLAQSAAWAQSVGNSAPGAVFFPKPTGGCYIISNAAWWGVSLIGQPMGGGTNSPSSYGVSLKSLPGQDVLIGTDPTTASFNWNPSWTIKDIAFIVNNSVASTSSTHRWPGRWFDDGAMTSGSAAFTTNHGEVGCSDIGQAIQVNGAGVSGANLVTTIASVSPCWSQGTAPGWQKITLTASASTTVTNAHSYISLLGLPVTTTIGNCGIAMDDYDANPADFVNTGQKIGSLYPIMDNVVFQTTNGGNNNSCGLYTQGQWGLYGLTVKHFNFFSAYFAVVQGASELNSYYASNSGDFEQWDHGLLTQTYYPWISYNGGEMRWQDVEMTVGAGPQFLQLGNQWADTFGSATLNIAEFETFGTPTTYGLRLTGNGSTLIDTEIAPAGMNAYIDAQGTNCNCFTGGSTPIMLYGSDNVINGPAGGQQVTDLGRGNIVTGSYVASAYDGLPLPYQQTFIPIKGRQDLIGSVGADFLSDGNYSTPYKRNDLFLWPQDFLSANSTPAASTWVADSASPTGWDFIMVSGGAYTQWAQWTTNGTTGNIRSGTDIPEGSGTLSFSAKCLTGTTLSIEAYSAGGAYPTHNFSCSTAFQTYSFTYALTSTGIFNLKNVGSNSIYLAWADIQPSVNLPTGSTLGGIGVAGVGAAIATGPLTSTAGDCVKFADNVGTLADAGAACGTGTGGSGSGATLPYIMVGGNPTSSSPFSAGNAQCYDFIATGSGTYSKITYTVTTIDNTANLYDLGIYVSGTTTPLAHFTGGMTGTSFTGSTTGIKTQTFTSGSVSITAGNLYFLCKTAATATAVIAASYQSSGANGGLPASGGTSTGGVLGTATMYTSTTLPWTGTTNAVPWFVLHN